MTIQPRLGAGIRDYLPGDMIPRQEMLDKIRATFESFGFVPLDTPGLEVEEVLTGGDPNFRMNIFRAGLRGSEKEDLALRFDLTVPLARVIAQYGSQIAMPFKRYQTGKVWRGERPQAGRFREFVQFDADIVGSANLMADAEIVALMSATMRSLGFENFLIKVNNRKILNGLSEFVGFPAEQTPPVLRILDKLDKIQWVGVRSELSEEIGLDDTQLGCLERFLKLMETEEGLLERLRSLMSNSPVALEGIRELESIRSYVDSFGVPADKWKFDLSVARGLGYYTGPVFETVLTDLPAIGSVFSGGRYDDLVERFGTVSLPAVGASVGVDRLFAAMEKLNLVKERKTVSQVLILNFDEKSEASVAATAGMLREAGISAEVYLGKETGIRGQLAYAVKQEVPVVIIIGESERAGGYVQIKDMSQRTQRQVSVDGLVFAVKRIVAP